MLLRLPFGNNAHLMLTLDHLAVSNPNYIINPLKFPPGGDTKLFDDIRMPLSNLIVIKTHFEKWCALQGEMSQQKNGL